MAEFIRITSKTDIWKTRNYRNQL